MDPEHRIIVCMHAKAGCSTWKTIFANNTGPKPLDGDEDLEMIHALIRDRGMVCADDDADADKIRRRLKNGYKIAIVRHPFDR